MPVNDCPNELLIATSKASGIVEALAASLGEARGSLEDINEPYLLQIGMLQRTPRGRAVTARAMRHLGLEDADVPRGLFEDDG